MGEKWTWADDDRVWDVLEREEARLAKKGIYLKHFNVLIDPERRKYVRGTFENARFDFRNLDLLKALSKYAAWRGLIEACRAYGRLVDEFVYVSRAWTADVGVVLTLHINFPYTIQELGEAIEKLDLPPPFPEELQKGLERLLEEEVEAILDDLNRLAPIPPDVEIDGCAAIKARHDPAPQPVPQPIPPGKSRLLEVIE